MRSVPKRFVYIIRSLRTPERRYVGVTADPVARLAALNAGQNRSTASWRPWAIDVCIEVRSEAVAVRFEEYKKSGAGHAFATVSSSRTDVRTRSQHWAPYHRTREAIALAIHLVVDVERVSRARRVTDVAAVPG